MADQNGNQLAELGVIKEKMNTLDRLKANREDVDKNKFELSQKLSDIESKLRIGVTIAVILGLGGAGVGLLLVNAKKQIDLLQNGLAQNSEKLQRLSEVTNSELARVTGAVNQAVSDGIARQRAEADALSNRLSNQLGTDLMRRLRISVHEFCTGEYDGPCPPLPRYDPRNFTPDAIAKRLCGDSATYTVANYRSIGGGCCGYNWFRATCININPN